jgi:hypothetical protein
MLVTPVPRALLPELPHGLPSPPTPLPCGNDIAKPNQGKWL